MPNKNGTGPEGKGPRTGRGLGACNGGNARETKRGLGLRRKANNDGRLGQKKISLVIKPVKDLVKFPKSFRA